jgi:subtilisin-like proprotein convertase family protein
MARARFLLLALFSILLVAPASAQSTRVFTNTTQGPIGDTTLCPTPLVRNFTVTSNFIVGDVDLGVFALHTWRGDIRITLQSPSGTRQQLVIGDADFTDGDNFSVRLNDGGTQLVNTDASSVNHSSAAVPPYQHNFIPNAPLSVFNGQLSAGTWRLEICDIFLGADDGTFVRSDLYLTPATAVSGTGATFVVNTTTSSGIGSLRQAVIDANATITEADTIAFAISGAGPHTITLASALPNINDNGLLLDGTTQFGSQCRDIWNGTAHILQINMRGAGGFDGLQLGGANQTVRGLSITGFANAIVLLPGSNTATVQCNFLGLLADGVSNANERGALVNGANARIGGLDAGQGNVISANSVVGVVTLSGSIDTAIRGNFIGTDPSGMSARPNGGAINHFFGLGSWRDITRNLISGNTNAGIILETDDQISPSTDLVRVQRNVIGLTRDLSALMRNGGDGIRFPSGSISNVLIGGVADTQGNFIAGSDQGISLNNTPNIVIRGNTIARSGQNGIRITGASGVTIGGDAAALGNVIGGNGFSGIAAIEGASNVTILGNVIGPATITGGTFENQDSGIFLRNVSNITIGNGTAGGRNVIGGNGRRAITGVGTSANITIDGNYVGTDATGNVAVANGWNEGPLGRDAISFDQSGSFTNLAVLNNVIGGYEAAQLDLWTSTGNGIIIQGNNIGVGADGVSPIAAGNLEDLISMGGGGSFSNVLIGGSAGGQGNLIAFGARSGIRLESIGGSNIQVIGNTIRNNARNGVYGLGTISAAIISNQIYANGLIGIDLNDDGVTANDAGDGDSGPNDLLNFPEIIKVIVNGPNALGYNLTLDAPADGNGYRLEFFASDSADPSDFGEGEQYLGHVDISHAGGIQSFTGTLTTLQPVGIGSIISATTTRRAAGGTWDATSEFSAIATADGLAQLTATMSSEVFFPPVENPFATPGNDILLTTTVTNNGTGSTDANSIFVAISVDAAHAFFNDVTAVLGGVVGFQSDTPALTFSPGTDLRYSNSAASPASLAQCTYIPAAGYDPQVRHVCLNPKGLVPSGLPQGRFAAQIRVRTN